MTTLPETVAVPKQDPALITNAERRLATARQVYTRISSTDEYQMAAADLQDCKAAQKKLEDMRTSAVKPLNAVVKTINGWFETPMTALKEEERIIKDGMIAYQKEEERKRLALEAKAAEDARKERERLEAQAKKAEASGKVEKAETLRQAAEYIPQNVVIASSTPKVSGVSTRGTWKARITSKHDLIAYVAAHPEWEHLIDVNMTAINGLARSQKSSLALPGVEAFEEQTLAARAA